jgi:hypothetical protein
MRSSWSRQGHADTKSTQFPRKPLRVLSAAVCFAENTRTQNAPSRWRLRPAFRLTSAEAGADRRAINLGRSVLGASRTLGGTPEAVKAPGGELLASCDFFFSHRVKLRLKRSALATLEEEKGPGTNARPQEFAEPGTLSSTFPTNLPLPRSAPRGASSYRRPVLGAGRNLRHRTGPIKGVARRNFSQIAADHPIQPWPFQNAWSLPRRVTSRWSSSGRTRPGVVKTWRPSAARTSSNGRSGCSVAVSRTKLRPDSSRFLWPRRRRLRRARRCGRAPRVASRVSRGGV